MRTHRKEQTKWIVSVRTPEGQLKQEIFHFKPLVGHKLKNGDTVIEVS
jgi:hypothetical protein